ncbi:MAG: hypothetical protein DMG57_27805 [Acidobacteria bacterium]|nr:MAG: hypothetical protein DMG57_27805 [Acidobacteriota bacterium]
MRLSPQRRQLRQKATNYSGGCATHPIVRADADLGGLRTLGQFALPPGGSAAMTNRRIRGNAS